MPFEYDKRSPRRTIWWGRKESRDRTDASVGKPLNAVLPASTRMKPVTTVMRMKRIDP